VVLSAFLVSQFTVYYSSLHTAFANGYCKTRSVFFENTVIPCFPRKREKGSDLAVSFGKSVERIIFDIW